MVRPAGWQEVMIVLNDNYRIVTHEYNFNLQRKIDPDKNPRMGKRATSAEKWKNIGYWKDLSQLLASYGHEGLRSEIGGRQPPSKPYLVISELSRKLSSGLGSSVWGYGEGTDQGIVVLHEHILMFLIFTAEVKNGSLKIRGGAR